jgi:hypothetical protein
LETTSFFFAENDGDDGFESLQQVLGLSMVMVVYTSSFD